MHQLAAAFMVEILIWGFPGSSGVLLAAYLDDELYSSRANARTVLPLVGTLCTGIMYCSGSCVIIFLLISRLTFPFGLGLVIYPTIQYQPRLRRYYAWIGTLLCTVSLLGASYTTKVRVHS